jgi:hypothetical protein
VNDAPTVDPLVTGPPLARGSWCEVVPARWRDEDVVVKRLTTDAAEARHRFRREVDVGLQMTGTAGVVPVLGAGPTPEAPEWFAMPRLDHALQDRMRQGPLPIDDVVALARTLARTLAAVHARGVVHRDIKPSNILFDRAGQAVVADFGVAHVVDARTLTTPGTLVGTPIYMAPEQLRGGRVTTAADLYGLGATLAEALTGVSPAEPDALRSALRGATSSSSSGLVTALLSCLDDEPTRRPTAVALEGALGPRSRPRLRALAVASVATGALLAGAIGLSAGRATEVTLELSGPPAAREGLQVALRTALDAHALSATAASATVALRAQSTPLGDGTVRHAVAIERHGERPVVVVGTDRDVVVARSVRAAARAVAGGPRQEDAAAAWLGDARHAISLQAWEDASAALQKARRLDITEPWPMLLLATTSWWAGRDAEARVWLDNARATDLAPADRGYLDGLEALLDQRFDDATAAFAKAGATTGETAELLYGAFEAHLHGGRLAEAVATARRLTVVDPGNTLPRSHLVDIAAEDPDDAFAAFVVEKMALSPPEVALLQARRRTVAGDFDGARDALARAPRGTTELDVYVDAAACMVQALDARALPAACVATITGGPLVPRFGDTRDIATRAVVVAGRTPPYERPHLYELIAASLPEIDAADVATLDVAIRALDDAGRRRCPLAVARFTDLPVATPFAAAFRVLFRDVDVGARTAAFATLHARRTPASTSTALVALLQAEHAARQGQDPGPACRAVLQPAALIVPIVSLAPRCAALVERCGHVDAPLAGRLGRWRGQSG